MASSRLDLAVEQILAWLKERKTNTEIADLLDTSEASIRRAIDRHLSLALAAEERNMSLEAEAEGKRPGIEYKGDASVQVTLPVASDLERVSQLKIAEVMERHGLSEEDWECTQALPNVWQGQRKGGEIVNYYQFKLIFKKRVPIAVLLPAYEPLERPYFSAPVNRERPVVTVIETDQQHPFILPELNELALQFIHWLQPDRHVTGGDLMNLGYISSHRDNPRYDDTVNEAKQATFEWLYDRRNACEDMEMWIIPGNHDDRIRNEQLERNERLYGVTQAHYPDQEEGPRVYSLSHLLRLDELGINYSEPEGTYEFEFVEITPTLAVRHGHRLSQNKAGPINTAMDLGHSVVLGHSHSQSAVARTVWDKITNKWFVRWAVEAGCECQHLDGLGFAKGGAADWQPGFVTVTSWPNGEFTFDFASFTPNNELLWRDKCFSL